MTCRGHGRAAMTEERSKAEIILGFAVSRREQVLRKNKNPRFKRGFFNK